MHNTFLPAFWRSGIIKPDTPPLEAVLQICKEFDPARVVAHNFRLWVLYFAYRDTDELVRGFMALMRVVRVEQSSNMILSVMCFPEWEKPYYCRASEEVLQSLSPQIGQDERNTRRAHAWRELCHTFNTDTQYKLDNNITEKAASEAAFDWLTGRASVAGMEGN